MSATPTDKDRAEALEIFRKWVADPLDNEDWHPEALLDIATALAAARRDGEEQSAALLAVARALHKERKAELLLNYTLPGGREKFAEAEAETDAALAALPPGLLDKEPPD